MLFVFDSCSREFNVAQPEAIHFIVNERNVSAGIPELFRV